MRNIGNRLELFVDDWLIDSLTGTADHRLHEPVPHEIALRTDAPWEGCRGGYITAFKDDDRYRMYYKANHSWNEADGSGGYKERSTTLRIAYAESLDGVTWYKPNLGLYGIFDSVRNNIVWDGVGPDRTGVHGFAPFKDTNPDVPPAERYKAFGTGTGSAAEKGIVRLKSPDAIRWQLYEGEPAITRGKFDSQNVGFWDSARQEYRAYFRDFHPASPHPFRADHLNMGMRDIRTCTSKDFANWSEPEPIRYTASPEDAFYTSQIIPYYRAPHILLGFPARYIERPWSETVELLPDLEERKMRSAVSPRYGTVTSDTVFMASRDGVEFYKWPDVYLRPGPNGTGGWTYGDSHVSHGLYETEPEMAGGPGELSFLGIQNYWRGDHTIFRRYSIRIDGFASVRANILGGELITKPFLFDGDDLMINYSTSAAGHILVEVQEPDGTVVAGLGLDDCVETVGDEIARKVRWRDGRTIGGMRKKPVRLRFLLRDADLYSIQFK